MAKPAPPSPHRALVIHPGALGDVLQAVPALRALATLDGGLRVSLAAQPRLGALLAGTGVVHESLSFDSLGLDNLFADAPVSAALADRLDRYHAVVSWFGARAAPYPERLRALVPRAVLAPPVPDADDPTPVWRHLLASLAELGAPFGRPAATAPREAWRAPFAVPRAWRERGRAGTGSAGPPSASRRRLRESFGGPTARCSSMRAPPITKPRGRSARGWMRWASPVTARA
jgi:hypothetical protein